MKNITREDVLIRFMIGFENAKDNKEEESYSSSLLQDVNFKNLKGETALHIACRENKIKAVRFFLEQGVDPSELNSEGKFAIELTNNPDIKNAIKESEKWQYLKEEAKAYFRIIGLKYANFDEMPYTSPQWKHHIKKVRNFIDKSENQENFEFADEAVIQDNKSNSTTIDITKNTEEFEPLKESHQKSEIEKNFKQQENFEFIDEAVIQDNKSNSTTIDNNNLLTKNTEETENQNHEKLEIEGNLQPPESKNENQNHLPEVSLVDLWRQQQEKINEEKIAKEEELKLRNIETNLMRKEDNLEQIKKEEKKRQQNKAKKDKKKAKIKEQKKSEENLVNNNEEEILKLAIQDSANERKKIEEKKRKEINQLDSFISEIYTELGIQRTGSINFEEYQEDKIIEILGLLLNFSTLKKKEFAVEKLLNHHFKDKFIDFKDNKGKTALINACCADSCFGIAKLLIEKGADVKIFDKSGNSALHRCALKKDQENQEKKSSSQESITTQDIQSSQIAKMIIDQTANDWNFLSAHNQEEMSAFTLCCKTSGNAKVLGSLLETKAYRDNSDKMLIGFLITTTQTRNPSGEINQETLALLNEKSNFKPNVAISKVSNRANKLSGTTNNKSHE